MYWVLIKNTFVSVRVYISSKFMDLLIVSMLAVY